MAVNDRREVVEASMRPWRFATDNALLVHLVALAAVASMRPWRFATDNLKLAKRECRGDSKLQ